MFLTRGDMPHEASWAAWLRSAEGMVPIDPAQDALCAHKPAPGKCPWANGVRQVRGVKPPDLSLLDSRLHHRNHGLDNSNLSENLDRIRYLNCR